MTKKKSKTKGEVTRQNLIDAAYTLFVTQGYSATSMRSIADEVGLAVGGVYNHFSSKEDLFKTIINERHPFRLILPHLLKSEGSNVEEILRNTAKHMVKTIEDDPKLLNLFFIEFIEFGGKNINEVVALFAPKIMDFRETIEHADGKLRSEPPLAFFRSLLGTVIMYILTEQVLSATPIPKEMMGSLDDILDNFLYGVVER